VNATVLFIVLLTQQGYWSGGTRNVITVQPVAAAESPRSATLSWVLGVENVKLASGSSRIDLEKGKASEVQIDVPEVRVRTVVRLSYEIAADGKVLQRGESAVSIFPALRLNLETRDALKARRIVAWSPPRESATAAATSAALQLRSLGASVEIVSDATKLSLASPDIAIVLPGAMRRSTLAQDPLEDVARSGTQVLVLEQRNTEAIATYKVVGKPPPDKFEWREGHPLLASLAEKDLKLLLQEIAPAPLLAVHLPADEPVLEVVHWHEVAAEQPTAVNCLLAVKTIGKGRIVWCQLPFQRWDRDPRAAILLHNAMQYLLAPPEPTPRPSERTPLPATNPVAAPPQNRIELGR
jgi:hypothetical protein